MRDGLCTELLNVLCAVLCPVRAETGVACRESAVMWYVLWNVRCAEACVLCPVRAVPCAVCCVLCDVCCVLCTSLTQWQSTKYYFVFCYFVFLVFGFWGVLQRVGAWLCVARRLRMPGSRGA